MKKMNGIYKFLRNAVPVVAWTAGIVAVDFGLTFLYSLIPEVNDGICGPSLLMRLFWGEDGWTRARYFEVFRGTLLVMLILLTAAMLLRAAARKTYNEGR